MQKAEKWQEYYAQAVRFAQLSHLASEHAKQEKTNHSSDIAKQRNFDTYETITIGVCHGFALEMLIKGIREKNNLPFESGHELQKLMNKADFSSFKQAVQTEFETTYEGYNKGAGFSSLMKDANKLFVDWRYHFEGKALPPPNADFTSFLYKSLKRILTT